MSKRLEMLQAMIDKGSVDPFVWYARAMELRSLERLGDAAQAYTEIAERFPEYVPTYLMAGQTAEALGDKEQARQWYERGIDAATKAADGHAASELRAALEEC